MTVAAVIGDLLPIMYGPGAGSEVMQRIAAPMVGGTITPPLLSMLVVPVAYLLLDRPRAGARLSFESTSVKGEVG
jgi:Cu(I)/Ag(I) efflux system membrane protein CusA/SilA